jgi:hypothetical protein
MGVEARIVDRDLRARFTRMEKQLKGQRNWKEMTKFRKYKKGLLDEPWKKRGIDEEGRPGAWAPNAISTAKRKAKKHLGLKRMKSSEVTYFHRVKWLMRKSGATKENVRVGFSKKRMQFTGAAGRAGSKYAYMHLHGKPGKFPARPWFVWTNPDLRYLAKLTSRWGGNLGRSAA